MDDLPLSDFLQKRSGLALFVIEFGTLIDMPG